MKDRGFGGGQGLILLKNPTQTFRGTSPLFRAETRDTYPERHAKNCFLPA